jgi:hypothetical protein
MLSKPVTDAFRRLLSGYKPTSRPEAELIAQCWRELDENEAPSAVVVPSGDDQSIQEGQ